VLVFRVIGECGHAVAKLFVAGAAVGAGTVGVDHAANGSDVSFFESLDGVAGLHDATDNFVTRHAGVDGRHHVFPFIAGLMKIGMADTAV